MSSYTELMQMCRLCLVKEQVNLPIFDGPGELQQIFLKITACLPVKVSREDNLPKSICDGCSYKLDLLYQFWNTSSNSEKQLVDWLTEAGVDPKHTSNEPIGLASQPNVTLKQEPVGELDISTDAQNYIMQQQQLAYKPEEYEESQQNAKSTKSKATPDAGDEPSPKRPRRATRNSKSVRDDDTDDDYVDTTVTDIAKTEEETEEDEEEDDGDVDDMGDDADDMGDPDFIAAGEDTDQPGPSGLGSAKTATGPSALDYASVKSQYGLKECIVFVGKSSDFDHKLYRFMKTQAYCDVDTSNIVASTRLKYKCEFCTVKFRDYSSLSQHMRDDHRDDYDGSSVSSQSSAELYEPEDMEDDSQSGGELSDTEAKPSKPQPAKKTNVDGASNEKNTGGRGKAKPSTEGEVIMWEQPSAIKKCLKCMQIFKDKRHYGEHLKTVHNVFACMLCPQAFYSETNFTEHIKKVHQKCSEKWRCTICNLSFTDFWNLSEHNFAVHRPMCNQCPREFPDVKSLVHHKTYKHSVDPNNICKDCGLTLPDRQSLVDHCLQHGYLYFSCEKCSDSFTTKAAYLKHMQTAHVGDQPSSRVLHLDKRLRINATKKILPQPPLIAPRSNSTVTVTASTVLTSVTPSVSATTTAMKVPIPRLNGPRPSALIGGANTSTTLVQVQNATTGQKEHKLLVVEKDTNKAFLVTTVMLNQNGQVKYAVSENAVPEPVTINNPLPTMVTNVNQPSSIGNIQSTIGNIQPTIAPQQMGNMQPTIAQQSIQNIQPSMTSQPITNMQPTLTSQPMTNMQPTLTSQPITNIQPAMAPQSIGSIPITQPITIITNQLGATVVPQPTVVSSGVHSNINQPTFVMSSLPNTSTIRFTNNLPPRSPNIVPQQINPKLSSQNPQNVVLNKLLPVNHMIQPKIIAISSSGVNTPTQMVAKPPPSKVSIPRVVKQYGRQYAAKKTGSVTRVIKIAAKPPEKTDIEEMPKLEIQSVVGGSQAVAKVINARLDGKKSVTDESAPVLIAESNDSGRPKIFLKPLNQLLEKPLTQDPLALDSGPKPSMSSCKFVETVLEKPAATSMSQEILDVDDDCNPSTSRSNSIKQSSRDVVADDLLSYTLEWMGRDTFYKCKHCSFRFKKLTKIVQHQQLVKCKKCLYTGCYKAMDDHYKEKHKLKCQCMTCGRSLSGFKALRAHNKTHFCVKCKKFYVDLSKHQTMLVCFLCNQFLCTAKDLSRHYYSVHHTPAVCTHCKLIMTDTDALQKHKKDVHYCKPCNSFQPDMTLHNCNQLQQVLGEADANEVNWMKIKQNKSPTKKNIIKSSYSQEKNREDGTKNSMMEIHSIVSGSNAVTEVMNTCVEEKSHSGKKKVKKSTLKNLDFIKQDGNNSTETTIECEKSSPKYIEKKGMFVCLAKDCGMKYRTLKAIKLHQRRHVLEDSTLEKIIINEPTPTYILENDMYVCLVRDCGMKYPTEKAIELHKRRHVLDDSDLPPKKLAKDTDENGTPTTEEIVVPKKTPKIEKLPKGDSEFSFPSSRVKPPTFVIRRNLRSTGCLDTSDPNPKEEAEEATIVKTEENPVNMTKDKKPLDPLACRICTRRYKDDIALQRHIRNTHHAPLKCELCISKKMKSRRFRTHKSFAEHMMNSHRKDGKFTCKEKDCEQQFASLDGFSLHMRRHRGEYKHKCPDCGREFYKDDAYRHHRESVHEGVRYICDVCGSVIRGRRYFREHVANHQRLNPMTFECEVCHKFFSTQNGLKLHMRIHTGEGFMCHMCGQKSSQYGHHKQHLRTHENTRQSFVCEQCGAKYMHHDSFFAHMQRAHKFAPLKCTHCTESFGTRHKLLVHMHTHDDIEKPLACTFCDQRFLDLNFLRAHVNKVHIEKSETKVVLPRKKRRRVTSSKTFVCVVCNDGFASHELLRGHLKIHEEGKEVENAVAATFICNYCNGTFANMVELNEHLVTHRTPDLLIQNSL